MKRFLLKDVLLTTFSGEWGTDSSDDKGVAVLRTTNFTNTGDINYLNVVKRCIEQQKIDKKKLNRGDIILEKSGGTKNTPVGRVVYFDADGIYLCNNFTQVLRANIDLVDGKYLFYCLFAKYQLRTTDNLYNKTTGIQNLQMDRYLNLTIPMRDKNEQRQICKQLDFLRIAIEQEKKIIKKLDELVKSQFIEMFGDPRKNEKGWERVYLSDIAEYYNGLTYQPDDVDDNGIIVLRSSNIQGGELDFSDTVRVSCPLKSKLFVKDKDILMCSRNGSAKLVGKVALIKKPQEDMTFGAFMMIIRSAYPEYLLSYFNTLAFREEIKTGATTTINQITSSMLNKIKLPFPPKTMLGEFARFVEQTDKSKFRIKQSLEKLEICYKSLLQKYFG